MWKKNSPACDHIRLMRRQLVEKIKEHGGKQDFSFVLEQRGMFSYSGLNRRKSTACTKNMALRRLSSPHLRAALVSGSAAGRVAAGISLAVL